MNITAADIKAFDELLAAAIRGEVPSKLEKPIAVGPGAETTDPRRVIIYTRQEAQQAWKHRKVPAQMAVLERAVEHLTVLKIWFKGWKVDQQ